MPTKELDLTGLKCPLPALRTKKALSRLRAGERLHVRCTDPMAAIDIPHLINAMGHRLIDSTRDADGLSFTIEIRTI